jgi:hypothetical protein
VLSHENQHLADRFAQTAKNSAYKSNHPATFLGWPELPTLFYLHFTLRFDDVLDVRRLEAGLDRLMGTWDRGQFGACLRLNVWHT